MRQLDFPLYPTAPGKLPVNDGVDNGHFRSERFIKRVEEARGSVYFADNPSGAFAIICPGGGYEGVSVDKEGNDFARLFAHWGISSLVLTYRMPGGVFADPPVPLSDLWRSVEIVREHAAEWKIDTAKIGVVGFSAGGHLALSAALYTASAGNSAASNVDTGKRGAVFIPAFTVVAYPVVTFRSEFAHMGSRNNYLGRETSDELVDRFSWERQVRPDTAPMFVVHSDDDGAVPVRNATALVDALRSAKVPYRFVRHPSGGHGFGMGPQHGFMSAPDWTPALHRWFDEQGMLSRT